MLIKRHVLDGIVSGEVELQFRRWKRPTVKSGGTLKTAVGIIGIDAVDVVSMASLSDEDARQAGLSSKRELVEQLRGREGRTYRVRLRHVGADPRIALREAPLTPEEKATVELRLHRMDRASQDGPWTRQVLALIASHEGVRAPDLAEGLGQPTPFFKGRVRRLKELGLTESLKVGYRLSARGRSLLE